MGAGCGKVYDGAEGSGAKVKDRRHHQRARVLRRAKIVFNRGYGALDCVLLDLSPGGARLKLHSLFGVPDRFELRIENGPAYAATVRYRETAAAGISFEPA